MVVITPGHRTFFGASFAQLAATVALFTRHLTGEQWITIIPLILAIYGAKSVGETYVKNKLA